jgi:hypothetical protein
LWCFPDRLAQAGDLLIEEIQVREDRADPHRVQVIEATLERRLERRDLLAQLPPRELGQDRGIGRAPRPPAPGQPTWS